MTIKDIMQGVWNLVLGIATIPIPVGEYTVTIWQIFIFMTLGSILMSIFGGAIGGSSNKQ